MSLFRNCLVAVSVICGTLPAQEVPSITKVVKSDVVKMNEALFTGNYAQLVDLTYPDVVKMMGGRDRMIALTKREMESMKESGFAFQKVKVSEPGEQAVNGSQTYIVVPFEIEMKLPDGVAFIPSFVIGVSEDKGKSWTYVNGDLDIKRVKTMLPNLPEALKIPARVKPRVVKN